MVDIKSKIYHEENNQIIGAEVTVYSQEGDNIGSIQITSQQEFDDLVNQLNSLSENFLNKDNLETELVKVHIDANTLSGKSSADFALMDHNHGDIYSPKNHAVQSNTYGLGNESNYGHAKVIDNVNKSIFAQGESLSAHQGYVLKNLIESEVKKLTTWNSQKVGSYGTLKINTQLRCCQFNYTRENYKLNGDKTLHGGIIPATYRPKGVVRHPSSKYTIINVDSKGDIYLNTTYSGSATTTLRVNMIWFY